VSAFALFGVSSARGEVVVCSSGRWNWTCCSGDVHSLKEKRSVVRPVVAELRGRSRSRLPRRGHLDLHRRALVGVAVVAADAGHCREVLDACERLVADRPELEVLSARQRLFGEDD
jgi:uncharacterized protein YlxP (DUF503 family)